MRRRAGTVGDEVRPVLRDLLELGAQCVDVDVAVLDRQVLRVEVHVRLAGVVELELRCEAAGLGPEYAVVGRREGFVAPRLACLLDRLLRVGGIRRLQLVALAHDVVVVAVLRQSTLDDAVDVGLREGALTFAAALAAVTAPAFTAGAALAAATVTAFVAARVHSTRAEAPAVELERIDCSRCDERGSLEMHRNSHQPAESAAVTRTPAERRGGDSFGPYSGRM